MKSMNLVEENEKRLFWGLGFRATFRHMPTRCRLDVDYMPLGIYSSTPPKLSIQRKIECSNDGSAEEASVCKLLDMQLSSIFVARHTALGYMQTAVH